MIPIFRDRIPVFKSLKIVSLQIMQALKKTSVKKHVRFKSRQMDECPEQNAEWIHIACYVVV